MSARTGRVPEDWSEEDLSDEIATVLAGHKEGVSTDEISRWLDFVRETVVAAELIEMVRSGRIVANWDTRSACFRFVRAGVDA